MNKYEKMWKLLKVFLWKGKTKYPNRTARWDNIIYMMSKVEREINVHEETKTTAEFNLEEARIPKSDGEDV